jgi:hypothetical protein
MRCSTVGLLLLLMNGGRALGTVSDLQCSWSTGISAGWVDAKLPLENDVQAKPSSFLDECRCKCNDWDNVEFTLCLVKRLSELPFYFQIPATTTRILLNHFKWDKEKLLERYGFKVCNVLWHIWTTALHKSKNVIPSLNWYLNWYLIKWLGDSHCSLFTYFSISFFCNIYITL